MIQRIKNLLKFRKPYALNKDSLEAISEAEKGLIAEYRKKKFETERQHVAGQETMARELARVMAPSQEIEEGKVEYLYDFLGGWSAGNNIIAINEPNSFATNIGVENNTPQVPMDFDVNGVVGNLTFASGTPNEVTVAKVIAVKPIDVFHELERIPGPEMIENIDAKIAVLKNKKNLIRNNSYCTHELIDMVMRLENRKKWSEFKEFYEQFDNTTSDKVQDLVNKYKLVLKGSDLFISKFPDEAINIMSEYTEQTIKLCGKQPVYYVIAEEKDFKKEYKRNDPILLVQSPFGAYWQILGAWDKEMILLEEL